MDKNFINNTILILIFILPCVNNENYFHAIKGVFNNFVQKINDMVSKHFHFNSTHKSEEEIKNSADYQKLYKALNEFISISFELIKNNS